MSEKEHSEPHGSTITFHNIYYKVKVKSPGRQYVSTTKDILINVSGIFKQGMNAILGPTGSGKSSLLDILAGLKNPKGLSGTVLVDGSAQPENFQCMTGYVVQNDVVCGTLTVRENLMFSANLRLPPSVTLQEKLERVEDIVSELGLEKCADSKLGTEFIRGVSGGERKRTNIGMELIISPPVLFLDEPTTGLDASTSNAVMSLLHKLSRRGRTIIFAIHQPRYSIFKKFDQIMLLSEGRTVFHGPSDEALDYFSDNGYMCEVHNNPADFFLDVILGDVQPEDNNHSFENGFSRNDRSYQSLRTEKSFEGARTDKEYRSLRPGMPYHIFHNEEDATTVTSNGEVEMTDLSTPKVDNFTDPKKDVETGGNGNGGMNPERRLHKNAIKLALLFNRSKRTYLLQEEIDPIYTEYQKRVANGTEAKKIVGQYATGFYSQMKTLSGRALTNMIRDPQTLALQMFLNISLGLITGTIYIQLDNDIQSGVQNRVGAFFFIIIAMALSSYSAMTNFIQERAIFMHESVSGFYRVSAYFISKSLFDVVPMRFIPTIFFAIITYFMIGFQVDGGKFFIYFLTLLMATFTEVAITFFASALTPSFAVANLICVLLSIVMMIFGGLLINVETMAGWLSWLQYVSLLRYALNVLYINELKDMEFCATLLINGTSIEQCDNTVGNAYLTAQGISHETAWDLWSNFAALLAILCFFMSLAYIFLRYAVRPK